MSDTNSNFNSMRRRGRWFILFPLLFIGVGLLMGGAVMWLWNTILPPVLGVSVLTFWQAVGLLILCRILFGGFRGGGGHWGRHGGGWGSRSPMRQNWMQMSDEERTKLRAEWRERCGKRDSENN